MEVLMVLATVLLASGGTFPYSYIWSNGTTSAALYIWYCPAGT